MAPESSTTPLSSQASTTPMSTQFSNASMSSQSFVTPMAPQSSFTPMSPQSSLTPMSSQTTPMAPQSPMTPHTLHQYQRIFSSPSVNSSPMPFNTSEVHLFPGSQSSDHINPSCTTPRRTSSRMPRFTRTTESSTNMVSYSFFITLCPFFLVHRVPLPLMKFKIHPSLWKNKMLIPPLLNLVKMMLPLVIM